MSRGRDPSDWMLSQAFGLIEEAERLHRQFFRLSSSARPQPCWEPPVDVFEDERELVVVVAMPGSAATSMRSGAVVVRGIRPLALTGARRVIRQLEIPYGVFERRVSLPEGRFEVSAPEIAHGCLVLRLRKLD